MVSSYLVCDVCGNFGPPASFVNKNELRLCYQCWFQECQGTLPPTVESDRGSSERAIGKPLEGPTDLKS